MTTLRGIAAFWVVFVHNHDLVGALFPPFLWLRPLFDAGVMMPTVFFVLSGYVLGLRYRCTARTWGLGGYLRFLALRLGRVYPVHALTLLAAFLMFARNGFQEGSPNSPGSLVANLLLVHAWAPELRLSWVYPSWSLSSEWFAYLVFPAVVRGVDGIGRRPAVAATILCAIISGLQAPFLKKMAFAGLLEAVPTFVGGVLLSVWAAPISGTAVTSASRRASLLGLGLLALPFVMPVGIATTLPFILVSFALVGLLGRAGTSSCFPWRLPALVWLGEVSFPLYLVHPIYSTVFDRVFRFADRAGDPAWVRFLVLAGWLGGLLGVSALVHKAVEEPGRRLSKRLLGF